MMNIENFSSILISIILGMLPETMFFSLFIIYSKNLKKKRMKLFILMSIAYTFFIICIPYKVLSYLTFIFVTYLILIKLYKDNVQIIDIFVIFISSIYLTLLSYICFFFLEDNYSNYYILLLINRILLFLPFAFKKYFNILYNKYKLLWNRNDKMKNPIKSITLRNISLISINISIFLLNFILLIL